MPTSCCAVDCSNRHSKDSNIPFYKMPSGKIPFEAKRRRDWIKAINRQDWATWPDEKVSKERICGAHFLSGKFKLKARKSDVDEPTLPRKRRKPKYSILQYVEGHEES